MKTPNYEMWAGSVPVLDMVENQHASNKQHKHDMVPTFPPERRRDRRAPSLSEGRLAGTHLLERLDSPNGMSRNYTYEPHRDLIATLNDKRGTTAVVNRSYTYNALGIPTNRTVQRQGTTRNDTFTHNDRSELTAATMGADNYAYDYDNIGNRKTAQETAIFTPFSNKF